MPLVPAKCPECGGNVVVDNEKDAWICDFCKTPFIVEKAINNFNTINNITNNVMNNNDIKADVVNVYESKTSDFVIRAGELVEYTGESADVIVPNSVSSIGFRAFKNNKICSIKCPSSVKKIGERAFEGCSELRFVIFEAETIETGPDVFMYCGSIEKITHNNIDFPNIVSWYNYCKSNYKEAIFCFSLEDYHHEWAIPEGVKKIVNKKTLTGYGYNDLSFPMQIGEMYTIIIPDSVSEIGEGAFAYTRIEEIEIPGNVKKISFLAFQHCHRLKKVIIHEGVEEIGDRAFSECGELESVSIPFSIKKIGAGAFASCYEEAYGGHPLRKLSNVIGPQEIIRKHINVSFESESPFVQKMSHGFCQDSNTKSDTKGWFSRIWRK